jgi:hypothetical protein
MTPRFKGKAQRPILPNWRIVEESWGYILFFKFLFIYFAVLEFELRAYTLSSSTSPFFCEGIFLR